MVSAQGIEILQVQDLAVMPLKSKQLRVEKESSQSWLKRIKTTTMMKVMMIKVTGDAQCNLMVFILSPSSSVLHHLDFRIDCPS